MRGNQWRVRRILRCLSAAVLLFGVAGCSAAARTGEPGARRGGAEAGGATLRVENRSWSDMNVYIVRGGSRIRVGTVTGNSTARFPIRADLVGLGVPLRFLADPIGGNRTPVSEEISVLPGDEVGLIIPPG